MKLDRGNKQKEFHWRYYANALIEKVFNQKSRWWISIIANQY